MTSPKWEWCGGTQKCKLLTQGSPETLPVSPLPPKLSVLATGVIASEPPFLWSLLPLSTPFAPSVSNSLVLTERKLSAFALDMTLTAYSVGIAVSFSLMIKLLETGGKGSEEEEEEEGRDT